MKALEHDTDFRQSGFRLDNQLILEQIRIFLGTS